MAENFVDDEIFEQLNFRRTVDGKPLFDVYSVTVPIVIHWFTGAKVFYIYSYNGFDNPFSLRSGSWRVPVMLDLELTSSGWRITGMTSGNGLIHKVSIFLNNNYLSRLRLR